MKCSAYLEEFDLAQADSADHAKECNDCEDHPYPSIIPDSSEPITLCTEDRIDKNKGPDNISTSTMILVNCFPSRNRSKYLRCIKHGNSHSSLQLLLQQEKRRYTCNTKRMYVIKPILPCAEAKWAPWCACLLYMIMAT